MDTPRWRWNEFQHVGADFSSVAEVEAYDRKHAQFRDVAKENRGILELLALPSGARVLDLGAGTGHFVRAAARAGLRPVAVDVSETMLAYARREAEAEGLKNVEWLHAGFLSLDVPAGTFDAALTSAALHHLPDVWKMIALENIHRALKPDGRFILRDVVFAWGAEGHAAYFDAAVNAYPPDIRPRMETHIGREFSTLDWILEGMLARAGFSVEQMESPAPCFRVYVCRKTASK